MSSDAIEFTPLQATPVVPPAAAELERLNDVSVEVSVEIGRTRMTLGEALALGPGSVIGLHRLAGEPVDLLVNGRVIARGEVVVLDEEFGLRVTDVAAHRPALGAQAPEPVGAGEPAPELVAEPVGLPEPEAFPAPAGEDVQAA
jgi:flagellar motor switch protein FliN/FliY